jgi:DNA-binding beta-propeller fold protein YncE
VAQQGSATGSVVYVGQDGVRLQNIIIPCTSGVIVNFAPISLSLSRSLSGVLVKTLEGGVFLLRDAWMQVVVVHGCPRWQVIEFRTNSLTAFIFFRISPHKVTSKMNFLPAIPLSASTVPFGEGCGGIAVNFDGSLLATVDNQQHCVCIYSVVDHTAAPFIAGTVGTAGSAPGQFNYPALACFVHRNGVDTLLVCDLDNDRVMEVTASGLFLRAIAMKKGSRPLGIAERGGVIAVSLFHAHAVVLLQYETGAVKPEVTIGSGKGCGDGQLHYPRGVSFTADDHYILVADWYNDRVSKFSAVSGAFIAHVATKAANGIFSPRDVLQCEDGSIVVTQGNDFGSDGSVLCVGEDGVSLKNIIIPSTSGGAVVPYSVSASPLLHGVVVKTFDGNVFLLRNAWMGSNRCAWLSALATS